MTETKQYEVSFLARGEDGAAAVVSHLVRAGAKISNEGQLNQRQLAYPIKKEQSAYFGTLICEANPEAIAGIRDALTLDKRILRFLIIAAPVFRDSVSRQASPSAAREEKGKAVKPKAPPRPQPETALSNDLLEEKLEEILK